LPNNLDKPYTIELYAYNHFLAYMAFITRYQFEKKAGSMKECLLSRNWINDENNYG